MTSIGYLSCEARNKRNTGPNQHKRRRGIECVDVDKMSWIALRVDLTVRDETSNEDVRLGYFDVKIDDEFDFWKDGERRFERRVPMRPTPIMRKKQEGRSEWGAVDVSIQRIPSDEQDKFERGRREKESVTTFRPAVFLDFDCTISRRHLWGTLYSNWELCVNDWRDHVDACKRKGESTPKKSVDDLRFLDYVFGGGDRLELLRKSFSAMIKDFGTTLYVSTHGMVEDVVTALRNVKMLDMFAAVHAYDGVWTKKGDKIRKNAEMGQMRALTKMKWIDRTVEDNGLTPFACWFIDDSVGNYDCDGLGVGVLPTSRETIHTLDVDDTFRHNGEGLKKVHLDRIYDTIKRDVAQFKMRRKTGTAVAPPIPSSSR